MDASSLHKIEPETDRPYVDNLDNCIKAKLSVHYTLLTLICTKICENVSVVHGLTRGLTSMLLLDPINSVGDNKPLLQTKN